MTESRWPSATVVIPTYNRGRELSLVLGALRTQHVPSGADVQLVVVDDGSSDGTWAMLQQRMESGELLALRQENAGPARARNRGVEAARGELVVFLGDDTVPEPGWLLQHLEEHRLLGGAAEVAVLGYTSFPPGLDSPFLRWINEFGAQFGYLLIEDVERVPFNFFYTSNISLPRRVLLELGGFREDFPAAAWEDIELAYRASRRGLRLVYRPRARVLHLHRIRPRTFRHRQRTSGRSAAIFAEIHPELGRFLGADRVGGTRFLRLVPGAFLALGTALAGRFPGVIPGKWFQLDLDAAYLEGLAEGLQSEGRR
ncbi:MAG: glycosyltransferase family 2 protein [Acidobacteria bacterium]|jgi:GT2 family glycosyltransferase|nr:glycosyltransferase family 2 protein [Acidobacteriota bacterium]